MMSFIFPPSTLHNYQIKKEKVYFIPNLRMVEHITPQPTKIDFLAPELSKTGQITL
jgi:hypothetical protein